MAKKDYHLIQTGQEVQDILNQAQRVYTGELSRVTKPHEGDVCIVPAHDEEIEFVHDPTAGEIHLDVPYLTLRWEVDDTVEQDYIAAIRTLETFSGHYVYEWFPPDLETFSGTVTAGRNDFTLVADDPEEGFGPNIEYVHLYAVIPAIAYEYHNGSWVERKDPSDVLRYSWQGLTPAQQKQARENILAFPGTIVESATATPGISLAQYIRIQYNSSGVYAFSFTGKLSDEDTDTGEYKVVVISSKMVDEGQIANDTMPLVLVAEMDSENFELYRIIQYIDNRDYKYRLEKFITEDDLPQTLVSGQYVVPNPYSDVKTIGETADEFGITEQQVRDLFDGKYAYIKFDKTVLSITVVSKDQSWCVKFVSKDDLVEYTLYGITIIAGTFILIGTTFYKYIAESTSRKVTTLSGESTDAEYPSAKAVYNAIKDAATAGMSYDSITESIVVEPPHGSYDQSTETITL